MKGAARYSKQKAIDTEKDSYLLKIGPDDMAVCTECSAVYHNKRWRLGVKGELKGKTKRVKVVCPACQKIRDKFAGGYVTLQGEFLKLHREEILNLVRNKEERARHTNPLERIIEISEKGSTIVITTTTDKFAQMLGKVLNKAFSGSVEYKWSDDVKMARVTWTR
ncbi:MAG: ATPase [Deltaproteobacteria bacterium]|nr:ATPase [Deltaproteobacteria bacterium]